ncbi:D-alanyl-D-alanine carboxypeptidase family protein [Blautia sp. HCP3S3_G3]|uniref:D-alanyl-D-alanine carboxypeptidase family protein n=1 Tax=Blautia sp. HCP3S3_G3 TaxID=3438913 RepID=UPI003F8A7FCE
MNRTTSKNSARAARIRRRKRKRIMKTILLLLLMAVLAGGGGYLVYTLNMGALAELPETFRASREFSGSDLSVDQKRAKSFAADLCVVEEDVPLDSVSLESGQSGLLFDLSNKKVLYSNGTYNRVYPASITKIMTAMLALKYGNVDETVTITQENVTLEEGSQVCGFQAGDRLTLDQLVHCLLVYSGNDAASAIAEYVGGSTSNFVDMMNSYAAKLGCTGTHFTNPHGLQDENHYTTPYDIYLMLKEALKYPEFTEITQLPSYTVEYTRADGSQMATYLDATDHYLTGEASTPRDVTILGGKTGTTSEAGNCLALLSQNAYGNPYISIVMGASSKELLYQQMSSLLVNINGN